MHRSLENQIIDFRNGPGIGVRRDLPCEEIPEAIRQLLKQKEN